jgi:peptidoglycan/LPS O-acetylase OafA/YrhL
MPHLEGYCRWWTGWLMAFVPLVIFVVPFFQEGGRSMKHILLLVGDTSIHVAIALCILNAVTMRYRILNFRPIAWFGVLSFSIDLWQQPFIDRYSGGPWSAFPANVVLAVVFGCASYYFLERPFLRLRDHHTSKLATPDAAALLLPVRY